MNKTLLSPIAAALLLLAPMAATLVATPVAAQQRAAAPAASATLIDRFVMWPGARPERGQEVRFRLQGAPGGDAWVDIPGVILGVDLAETRPGHYEGSYTLRRRDNPDAFSGAVASLKLNNQRVVTATLDRGPNRPRDESAPVVSNFSPENGARVSDRGQVQISATLSDAGTGLDPATVRMRVDGRDVTAAARITSDEVRYREDLPIGRHAVEVTARDRAGNTTSKSWVFDVVDRDRMERRDRDGDRGGERGYERERSSAGPMPLLMTSHANGAIVDVNGAINLAGHTLPNANVRVQIESVTVMPGSVGITQPMLDQTLQADQDGNFSVMVGQRNLTLPGARIEVRLTATRGEQRMEQRITLHQRQG